MAEERIKRFVNADRGVSQEFSRAMKHCIECVCVCLGFNEKESDVNQN